MKTIYAYVKAEYTKHSYYIKATRICNRLGIGKHFLGKPGKYITDEEWQEVKRYLVIDGRKK